MERKCLQCGGVIPPGRGQFYCSDDCFKRACTWQCQGEGCGKVVQARWPSKKKTYCRDCTNRRLAVIAQTVFRETRERQIAQGRVLVECNYTRCPRPNDPIELTRSQAKRPSACRHPECKIAYKADCHGGNKIPQGKDVFCADCKKPMGYRPPSYYEKHKYCRRCAQQHAPQHRGNIPVPSLWAWQPCALPGCGSGRRVLLSEIKRSPSKKRYCCKDHFQASVERAPRIHCRACGKEQRLLRHRVPQTFDSETMTFLCKACRQGKTVARSFTCSRKDCGQQFRRRVPLHAREVPRFCSPECHQAYYGAARAICANPECQKPIPRRKMRNRYCSPACFKAVRRGQPNPHYRPSKAECEVLLKWGMGVRGVRVLAKEAGVARNTVRKMLRTGKLVEPALTA